jgi:hypothetical protein
VQSKANLWGSQPAGSRRRLYKQSQFRPARLASAGPVVRNKANLGMCRPGSAGGLCKTKPNLGRMGHLGDGAPGKAQWCETNPILRLRIADSGQPCGGTPLRTAGPGAGCTNKPNSAGPIVPNKPNSNRDGLRGPHHSTVPARCRLCQTNPIPSGAGQNEAGWRKESLKEGPRMGKMRFGIRPEVGRSCVSRSHR